MKTAIGYIRISTKDQSNFSITGQDKIITDYACKNNYTILATFTDDGYSAKNFDRPDWRSVENFVAKHHHQLNYIIVSKYDRFSRNVAEALQMIDKLEKKYNVRVLSASEPIALHPESPYFFKFRTDILTGAQVEWLVIKDRTRWGIHNANSQGRWVNNVPFGFIRAKDEAGRCIIKLDPDKSEIVKTMYKMLLAGSSQYEIKKWARGNGYNNRGRDCVVRTLSNMLYTGFVPVKKYFDTPANVVKGLHDGIITMDMYDAAMQILNPGHRKNNKISHDFYLRGVLKCQCGKNFTASFSKGKCKRFGYYFCALHRKFNYSSSKIHTQFDGILKGMSLPTSWINRLVEKINIKLKQGQVYLNKMLDAKNAELVKKTADLDQLEYKFITDKIDQETYDKWAGRYKTEINNIKSSIVTANEPYEIIWQKHQKMLPHLTDLHWVFNTADTYQKHHFIKLVFDNRLGYWDEHYRTPYIMPIFAAKSATLADLGLIINAENIKNPAFISPGSLPVPEIEHLASLLTLFSNLKKSA